MGVFTRQQVTPEPRRPSSRTTRLVPVTGTAAPATTTPAAAVISRAHLPAAPAAPVYKTDRALTAAAKVIDFRNPNEITKLSKRRQGDAWQAEAWEYYDIIGEIAYAFTLVSSVMSRLRLYAGEVIDPSQAPKSANPESPAGGAAISALARLDSAFGGQPGLLRDAALNLSVVGECYLVQRPGNPALRIPESWDIRSVDELQASSDGKMFLVTRSLSDQSDKIKLPQDAFVTRIWRPHPRYSEDADSSMRHVLDACAELLLLSRAVRSTARSRLNAGMLYLPDGISAAASPDPDVVFDEADPDDPIDTGTPGVLPTDSQDASDTDEFEESLIEAMTTPIADEESAAAVVPLIVRGPAELADKIKLFKFERAFDPHLVQRADKVMDRILAGLDLPKDAVAGMANVKYSNALVIEETLLKSHIEPLALLICDALTVGYLRPAMKAMGIQPEEYEKYTVWFDASAVTTRPNRAEDADKGYDKTLINGEAWRREHGFTKEDAPDPTEVAVRLLMDNANVTPELTEALLQVVAPEVAELLRAASQAANPAPLPPEVAEAIGTEPTDTPPDVAAEPTPTPAPAAPPSQPAAPAPSGGAPTPAATPINAEDLL